MQKLPQEPASREITPEALYDSRRDFIRNAAIVLGSATLIGGGLHLITDRRSSAPAPGGDSGEAFPQRAASGGPPAPVTPDATAPQPAKPVSYDTTEAKNSFEDITTYNNFYEFGTSKSSPAANSHTLKPRPWSVLVTGETEKEQRLDLDDILKMNSIEERVYRMRCVEAWSMVIPWQGFALADFIAKLKPTSKAKYVAFKTLLDPVQMPGQRSSNLEWPYIEGLRIDEATHPLTMLATGIYGKPLPNQNGAPLRLVVPWKYGFKGIKSIVEIRFTATQPKTSWNIAGPDEYGFFANVNPNVDHPRWTQARERRIGEVFPRKTLPFNGYGEYVAKMYDGMDLTKNF